MLPEQTTEEFVFWVNPLSQRELSSHSCSLIPQCDAAWSVAAGDPKKRLISRLYTFPRKGPWKVVDLRVQLWAWMTLKEGLVVTDLTFQWAATRRPITGGRVGVGLAEMKGGGSWLGGGSALAALRPCGRRRSPGHAGTEGRRPAWQKADEHASGWAPGSGDGVSVERANASDAYSATGLHFQECHPWSQEGVTCSGDGLIAVRDGSALEISMLCFAHVNNFITSRVLLPLPNWIVPMTL